MGFSDFKYEIEIRDQRSMDGHSQAGVISSGVHVIVYDAGTKTKSTIYADGARTAKTNDITRAQFAADGGKIVFWSAKTSHDILINDAEGNLEVYSGVTPVVHTLHLVKGSADKTLVIPFGASDNAEVDTGVDIPKDSWVKDVALLVSTLDDTETLNVGLLSSGTGGDADGLLAAASVAAAGWVKPWAVTVGGTETHVSTTTYGLLMGPGVVGANSATDHGIGAVPGHIVTGSNTARVTYTGSSGSDTAAGYIYIHFKRLR